MNAHTRLPELLVSTEWLVEHLGDPDLAIVDIRGYVKSRDVGNGRQVAEYIGAEEEYREAHIPGSVYVDWTRDIVDLDDPVPVQIASPERFAEAMSVRGIGNDTDVVIVDHSGGHFATRLWWALMFYGHDRAAVLDGGFSKWQRECRPVDDEVTFVARKVFVPKRQDQLIANAASVASAIEHRQVQIVDARDRETFAGDVFRGNRAGHIPGAVNVPAKRFFNDDGTWKDATELAELLAAGGVDFDKPLVAYCNGGVTATAVLFAMAQNGRTDFANYDGSWNEWGGREDLPVETGN